MREVGVITGTGAEQLAVLEQPVSEELATPHGSVTLRRGRLGGADAVHISRHGPGHARLSNHVAHRAHVWALGALDVTAVIGCTACGALDPDLAPGELVVFDDLYFPSNRLPDGQLATLHTEPGDPGRGHWIHDQPFAEPVRGVLAEAAAAAGVAVRDGGVYGHVDGPRYNTAAEVRALAGTGVTAISQTGGPETVLCGEAGLPYALLGYVTDHAVGVRGRPTAEPEVRDHVARGADVFAAVLAAAVPRLAGAAPPAAGFTYHYE
jgi:purine nucleoside phosphorylase